MKLYIIAALLALISVSYAAKPIQLGSLCLNQVNCFVNPCQFSRCSHPEAKCVANYCGGCNAFWYLDGKRFDCSDSIAKRAIALPKPTKCITVNCFVDPCGFAKCNKHPEAVCRSNYCGGCNAWFYVAGQRVQCD